MTRLTRADLDNLPAYVPGRNLADLTRELGIAEAIKLASNEVPYGPLPGVAEAVADAMRQSHRYPDMGSVALRDTLAAKLGVAPERIVTGCGSVALAEILVKATCLPGDEIVYSWRSFEAYPIISAGAGATSVRVPNTAAHEHDLPAMAAAITERTRLVIVCNPNNPTGTSVRKAELDRFIASVPSDVLIVLDEAYRELVTDPEVPDGVETYGDRPNVLVLRTMSKAWGLAGLRMGYLVAQPEVAAAIRKVLTPFSTSIVAQAAAIAALGQEAEVRRRCALVVAERDRVTEAMRALGVDVPSSQANFVWLPLGDGSAPFAQSCESRGVIVRPFQGDGVRVTIGTAEENDAFLAAAEVALKS
ncbi:histidinol-phosphate transaminase [Actinoplanes bogorensis]|uniref:Aromatic amino acid aminotransferase n=1 Tax=Paractinoplanes bogorensis TaxID=1610840 RepID=A0ABS5YIB9_9ACTN|nr:histidinol-phosphate transaminase [Actinoplanes bogorensis]MBU2663215.1 histidinol-phosphate transaminase [Actinoplanes bogorensis]